MRSGISTSLGVLWLAFIAMMILSSCQKSEGPGGTGSISGILVEQFYNDDYSLMIYEKPAVDEEIFILYGENDELGDRTFTGLTGEFKFNFLYPGRYYIYFKSRDSTQILDVEQEKIYLVDLERGDRVGLGTLNKLNILDFDDGAAVIKGKVWLIKYVDESRWPNLVVEYFAPAQEHEIYLTYGKHSFYDERIRTQDDGTFEFNHLIPGNYTVFLYSEDVTEVLANVVIKHQVTLTGMNQVVDLGEITIKKH